jgi:hypothetical protein
MDIILNGQGIMVHAGPYYSSIAASRLYCTCVLHNIHTVVENWMEYIPFSFDNKECADIDFISGFCNRNTLAAVEECWRLYVSYMNRMSNRHVFSTVH